MLWFSSPLVSRPSGNFSDDRSFGCGLSASWLAWKVKQASNTWRTSPRRPQAELITTTATQLCAVSSGTEPPGMGCLLTVLANWLAVHPGGERALLEMMRPTSLNFSGKRFCQVLKEKCKKIIINIAKVRPKGLHPKPFFLFKCLVLVQ